MLDLSDPPEKPRPLGDCDPHPESFHPVRVQHALDEDRGRTFYVEKDGYTAEKLGFPARKCLRGNASGPRRKQREPRWISAGGH